MAVLPCCKHQFKDPESRHPLSAALGGYALIFVIQIVVADDLKQTRRVDSRSTGMGGFQTVDLGVDLVDSSPRGDG